MEHHKPLDHYVIGLSGGIEEKEGGENGGDEHHGHQENHEHHEEEHKRESIGFTGSDFKTPVEVHHEKEVHFKVS